MPRLFVCLISAASQTPACALPVRQLRRLMPNARFLLGFWMLLGKGEKAEQWRSNRRRV
jgi:hypothetical protein